MSRSLGLHSNNDITINCWWCQKCIMRYQFYSWPYSWLVIQNMSFITMTSHELSNSWLKLTMKEKSKFALPALCKRNPRVTYTITHSFYIKVTLYNLEQVNSLAAKLISAQLSHNLLTTLGLMPTFLMEALKGCNQTSNKNINVE